jgi:hypothetical protein
MEKLRNKKVITSEMNEDLTKMFIKANLPFYKLDHPAVKEFLNKWTENKAPNRTTLTKNYVEFKI